MVHVKKRERDCCLVTDISPSYESSETLDREKYHFGCSTSSDSDKKRHVLGSEVKGRGRGNREERRERRARGQHRSSLFP